MQFEQRKKQKKTKSKQKKTKRKKNEKKRLVLTSWNEIQPETNYH
jgi:hypothetical protein